MILDELSLGAVHLSEIFYRRNTSQMEYTLSIFRFSRNKLVDGFIYRPHFLDDTIL